MYSLAGSIEHKHVITCNFVTLVTVRIDLCAFQVSFPHIKKIIKKLDNIDN